MSHLQLIKILHDVKLEMMRAGPSIVLLFLTQIRQNLTSWLAEFREPGNQELSKKVKLIEQTLISDIEKIARQNAPAEIDRLIGAINELNETIQGHQTTVDFSQIRASTGELLRANFSGISRVTLLNYCISHFKYETYLEIGCADNICFSRIPLENKVGVDPNFGGTHRMTSDEFFGVNVDTFDIIFIDGLHEAEQVRRDFDNALAVLNPNGTIVLHDCNPLDEISQLPVPPPPGAERVWNGDVWKAMVYIRTRADLDAAVANFDYGCGIVRVRSNSNLLVTDKDYLELTWEELVRNRERWLRLIDASQVLEWL